MAQEAFTESWALLEQKPGQWLAITRMPGWIRMVALRRYLRPPGPRIRPLLAEGTDIPDLPDPGPGPGRLTVLTQTVLQALRSLDEQTRIAAAFYLACDEDRYRILSKSVRSGRSPSVGLADRNRNVR